MCIIRKTNFLIACVSINFTHSNKWVLTGAQLANFSIILIAVIAFMFISAGVNFPVICYARVQVHVVTFGEYVEIFTFRNKNVSRYRPCISTFFKAELAVTSCTYVPISIANEASVSYESF